MSNDGKMSIQQRIRAMNQTMEKVELNLPASRSDGSPLKNTQSSETGSTQEDTYTLDSSLDHLGVDAAASAEQPEQQQPRSKRTSVVDMWRKRETAGIEPVATVTAASPGRRKSVLEKWSSAQQKQEALSKLSAEEEKKEPDDDGPLSVVEMIAKRSNAVSVPPKVLPAEKISAVASRPQQKLSIVDMMKARNANLQKSVVESPVPEPEPSKPQMSIGDIMKARNSTMGGTAVVPAVKQRTATPPTPLKQQQQLETDLVIVGSNGDDEDDGYVFQEKRKATPMKKTSTITNKWNQRGLVSVDTIPTTLVPEPQVHDDDDLYDLPTSQRQSVADIWSKRATSSPVINTNQGSNSASRKSSSSKPLSRPVISEEASSVVSAEEQRAEPPAKRWGSLRSPTPSSSTTHSNQEPQLVESKPAWTTESLNRSMEPKASDARSGTGSEISSTGKPAWANRSVLNRSIPPSTPDPSHEVSGSSSKPAWANRSVASGNQSSASTPEPKSVAPPSSNSKPAWANRSLNKSSIASSPAANPVISAHKPAWALTNRISFSSPEPKKAVDSRPSWAARSSPAVALPASLAEFETTLSVVKDVHVDDAASVASSKQEEQPVSVDTVPPKPKWGGRTKVPTNFSSPPPSSDSKPAWMKRSFKSPSPALSPAVPKSPTESGSKPAWARKSLSSLAAPPSPAKSVESSTKQQPAWARKSLSTPGDSKTSRSPPSPMAKPAWMTASLRKTDRSVGTPEQNANYDTGDDFASVHSEQPPTVPALASKKGQNNIDDSELENHKNLTKSWQKTVSHEEISPTMKNRNPNNKKIAIEMSSKNAVDVTNPQREVEEKALSPALNKHRSVAEELLESPVPQPLSPPRAFGKSPKLSPALDWPSAAGDGDDALDQAHEDAAQSQASVLRKQDSVRTPRSSAGRSSPRSSIGGASPSRSLVGLASRNGNALWRKTPPPPHDVNGKKTTDSKLSIATFDVEVADINDNDFEGPEAKPHHAPPKSPLVIELANQYRIPARGGVFRTNSPGKNRKGVEKTNTGSSQQLGLRSMSSLSRSEVKKTATPTRAAKKKAEQPHGTPNATPTRFSKRRLQIAQNHLGAKPSMSLSTAPSDEASEAKKKEVARKTQIPQKYEMHEVSSPRSIRSSDSQSVESAPNTPSSSQLGRAESKKEIQKRRLRMKSKRDLDGDDHSVTSTSSWISDSRSAGYSKPSSRMPSTEVSVGRAPPVTVPFKVNLKYEAIPTGFMDEVDELVMESPEQPSSLNVNTSQPGGQSKDEIKDSTAGFDEEFSRLAIARSKPTRPVEHKDDALLAQPSPLSSKNSTNTGAFSPYLPDNLSPRTLNPNASSRIRHKKELEQRKSRTPSGSNAGSATASDHLVSSDWTFFSTNRPSSPSDSNSVVSSASGSSALADRASRVLHRRRGRRVSSKNASPAIISKLSESPKIVAARAIVERKHKQAVPLSPTYHAVFDDSFVNQSIPIQQPSPPVKAPASAKVKSSVKRSQKESPTIDRSAFVNRYKSSERFIDTGNDTPHGLTPRYVEPTPVAYSFGSEVSERSSPQQSTRSSPQQSPVSSEDGSRLYLERRTDTLISESASGALGIDKNFRNESASNIYAMGTACKSVTVSDLAKDLTEDVAATFTGSVSAMKNFASELGKLTTSPSKQCGEALRIPIQARESHTPPEEEEVAIEIEYVGDYDYPDDEDFFDQRAMQKANRDSFDLAPAGQSSYEAKV